MRKLNDVLLKDLLRNLNKSNPNAKVYFAINESELSRISESGFKGHAGYYFIPEICFDDCGEEIVIPAYQCVKDDYDSHKFLLGEEKRKTIRRRIEDALRKTATSDDLIAIAELLGVKTE